ncbi:MAG TPA: alpha/beta hydrolase-fold protein [Thermomicrobiales bacterium]|nr:alpha/beta hydrolase-fold protein [Thermomicrobiales bacterium]
MRGVVAGLGVALIVVLAIGLALRATGSGATGLGFDPGPPGGATATATSGPAAALATITPPPAAAPAGTPAATSAATSPARSPSRVESRTFYSPALGRNMPYFAFIPPGYDSSPRQRFPVVYALHGIGTGSGGSDTEWYAYGLLEQADQLMRAGVIQPFLIILPQGDGGFWMDWADGGPRWGTYLEHDVVAEVDARYRTLPDRAHRAVGGLSMGAYGALQISLNYPQVFGIVAADSPTLRDRQDAPAFFGDAAYFAAHDPISLARDHPDVAKSLKLWIDVGQDDPWRNTAEPFHQQLLAEGIPHEWHVWPGTHNEDYWKAHVGDYLLFYNRAFGPPAPTAP